MLWQFYLAKNIIFGVLPFKRTIRLLKRRFIPLPTELDPVTFTQSFQIVDMLKEAGINLQTARILEIGPGWWPVLPLILHLAGCRPVVLVDNERLLDKDVLLGTAKVLRRESKRLADELGQDVRSISDRLSPPPGLSFEELLDHWGFEYLAPCDMRLLEMEDENLDAVVTRAVLEYIPPQTLKGIMEKCKDLLKPDGVMCHIIDNSDQWNHCDPKISKLNFLKYSDRTANAIGWANPHSYQNRLRHYDYINLMEKAGFNILQERSHLDEVALVELEALPLNGKYRAIPFEDLAKLTSWIIASKKQAHGKTQDRVHHEAVRDEKKRAAAASG